MTLTLTLSPAELAALEAERISKDDTITDVLHRMLEPIAEREAGKRVERLVARFKAAPEHRKKEALTVLDRNDDLPPVEAISIEDVLPKE